MEMASCVVGVPIANCPSFKFAQFTPKQTQNLKLQNSSTHGLNPPFGLSFSSTAGRVRASSAADKPLPKRNTKSNDHYDHDHGGNDDRTREAREYVEEYLPLQQMMEECEVFRSVIDDTFEERKEDFLRCLAEKKRIHMISQLRRQIKGILRNEQPKNSKRHRREVTYIKLYFAQKFTSALSRFWKTKSDIDPEYAALIYKYMTKYNDIAEYIAGLLKPMGETKMNELLKKYGYEEDTDEDEEDDEDENSEDEDEEEVEDAQGEEEDSEGGDEEEEEWEDKDESENSEDEEENEDVEEEDEGEEDEADDTQDEDEEDEDEEDEDESEDTEDEEEDKAEEDVKNEDEEEEEEEYGEDEVVYKVEDAENEEDEEEEEKENKDEVEDKAEDARDKKEESKIVDDEKAKNKYEEDDDTRKRDQKAKGKKRGVHLFDIYVAFLTAMFIAFSLKKKN